MRCYGKDFPLKYLDDPYGLAKLAPSRMTPYNALKEAYKAIEEHARQYYPEFYPGLKGTFDRFLRKTDEKLICLLEQNDANLEQVCNAYQEDLIKRVRWWPL
jgi:hypothetical protein